MAGNAPNQHQSKFAGYLAEIVELSPIRTGIYGEVRQVLCKVLEGPDSGRAIKRNIAGKLKVHDKVRLNETTREAKQIKSR